MISLRKRLEEKLAFDDSDVREARQHSADMDNVQSGREIDDHAVYCVGYAKGARFEHARLQPIVAALIECADTLPLRKMHDDDCMDATQKFKPHEMCECGASVVKQALAKLTEALK